MKVEVETDYSKTPIFNLWQYDGEEVSFKFSHTDITYDVIEEVFHLTSHEGISSKIFSKMFLKRKNEYLSKHKSSASSFKIAVEKMWKPLLLEFKNDLIELRDGLKMPLKKVEYFFHDISDTAALTEQLEKWCDAVDEPDKSWVRDAAKKILDYQQLCLYSNSALTLMQLKQTLRLTGDFSAIEAVLPKEVRTLMYES